MEKCLSSTPLKKKRKYLSNVYKIGGAHLQCVNNHYAKFQYTGLEWKLLELHITQTRHHLSILVIKNV